MCECVLQEVGGNHAQSVGFSTDGFDTTITMRKMEHECTLKFIDTLLGKFFRGNYIYTH